MREGAPLGSALVPYFRAGLYPGFCPPLAGMEDHFSMRRPSADGTFNRPRFQDLQRHAKT